jgi:transposase
MTTHYIALDVHCAFTEVAVVTESGRLTKRFRCGTTIPELVEAVESIRRPRRLTFEEGPMAEWLYRHLLNHVEEVTVCEPRRNRLISQEGDKDDPIDSFKLAQLYRGGYLKAVHHPESLARSILKQHVALYHDRVRQRVREANYLIAQVRRHGVVIQEADFADPADRPQLLEALPKSRLLREDLECLWKSYDVITAQVDQLRCRLEDQARKDPQIRRFERVPGYGWIRAATFYVYIDTPWRFRSKSALWKYVGIGLERHGSGNGPRRLRVVRSANRRLKNVALGAALSAVGRADNPFAVLYRRWTQEERLSYPNARRNVARSQTATLWGMWKTGSEYRPELVTRGVAIGATCESR